VNILINIDVPDIDRAIAFYRDQVGFELDHTFDGDTAELRGATATLYLLRKPAGSNPVTSPTQGNGILRAYARHWTPVHFDLVVDDVDTAAARAIEAGARQETGHVDWRGSRCVSLSDPFGHGFCFIQFTNDTYED